MAEKYVPALKAREAEIKALLRAPASLAVTPLFELQEASSGQVDPTTGVRKRSKGSATDAAYFVDDIARLWGEPLYVDISRVAGAGSRAPWWRLLDVLNSVAPVPIEMMPVLVPDDGTPEHHAAAGLASVSGRAALRVEMTHARMRPGALSTAVRDVAAGVGVSQAAVDVILDWGDALEVLSLDELERDTIAVIRALGAPRGDVITLGTPNSDGFVQVGDWNVVRREWWLWLRIRAAGYDATFGDYALYPPTSPVPVSPKYGHLRYSSGDRLHVHRRAVPSTGGGLGGAFTACCQHLVGQPHWLGPSFSGADRRIDDIASNADKESQAGKWRQLAAEHHIALVANQLTGPLVAPPPGTL